ncbi:MAG: ATP-dependent Clp protease ATP-binding subunit ClpA, partial [bacterium]
KKLKRKKKENIEDFTENLNKMAADDKLDPLIGREKILSRTMQILCRKNKHNPVHVGEAGVGKTAITEGLAQRILTGDVPKPLRDAVIFRMNMGAMLAGTKYRGEFEKG